MTTPNEEVGTGYAVTGLLLLLTLPFAALWEGFVLSRLWGWFVVPTFDARPLSAWMAAGLLAVVAIVKLGHRNKDTRTTKETITNAAYMMWIVPAMLLGMGWFFRWWGAA